MLNLNSIPSLQSISLNRIASKLWNHYKVRMRILSIINSAAPESDLIMKDKWKEIENLVLSISIKLQISTCLIDDLQKCIYGIGWHIFEWMQHYNGYSVVEIILPKRFCWTFCGCIDEKKTAELIVSDECVAASERFKLACLYCLEDKIYLISHQLQLQQLVEIMSSSKQQYKFVKFWYVLIEKYLGKSLLERNDMLRSDAYRRLLLRSVCKCNKAACEFYWKDLDPVMKTNALLVWIKDLASNELIIHNSFLKQSEKRSAEVLCYILSLMDNDQKLHVLTSYPYSVLRALLHWPWQCYFMEAATMCWKNLSKLQYYLLLKSIIQDRIEAEFKDYDYYKLVYEFWQQSPASHKSYVKSKIEPENLLYFMFVVNDQQGIELILKDMTPEMKQMLIFSKSAQDIFRLIHDKKNLLEYFLRECISSRKLSMEFIYYVNNLRFHDVEKQPIWVHLLAVLDDIFVDYVQNGYAVKSAAPKI